MFSAYVLLYAVERAMVEQLRTDSLYMGPLRVSQILSLAALFGISVFLFRRGQRCGNAATCFFAGMISLALFILALIGGRAGVQILCAGIELSVITLCYTRLKRAESGREYHGHGNHCESQ